LANRTQILRNLRDAMGTPAMSGRGVGAAGSAPEGAGVVTPVPPGRLTGGEAMAQNAEVSKRVKRS